MNTHKLFRLALVLGLTAIIQLVVQGLEVHFMNLLIFGFVANLIVPELEKK
jgi:hypothetical protein